MAAEGERKVLKLDLVCFDNLGEIMKWVDDFFPGVPYSQLDFYLRVQGGDDEWDPEAKVEISQRT